MIFGDIVFYIYFGGFYVDIDTISIGHLDNFIKVDTDFITLIDFNRDNPIEGKHNLACGFIGARPKHPILLNCIKK